jgi:hypothetical protein
MTAYIFFRTNVWNTSFSCLFKGHDQRKSKTLTAAQFLNLTCMQVINWNPEWAQPECVLLKRKCWSLEHNHGGAESTCRDKEMKDTFEWYVKWVGLGYEDCTWECEDSGVLAAPGASKLFSAYEKRTEAARQRTTRERVQEVHNNLTLCSFFIFVSSLMIGS